MCDGPFCDRCGAPATHYTIDGLDSRMICERYPSCGPPDRYDDAGRYIPGRLPEKERQANRSRKKDREST